MLKPFVLFFSVLLSLNSLSQELLMPETDKQDTARLKIERQIMYQQMLSGISPAGEKVETWQLPDFNLKGELLNRWSYNLPGFSDFYHYHNLLIGSPVLADPFLRNGTLLSKGSYQLGDNLKVGGYSYGGNSVFSAPFPNQEINNYDFRGSAFFLQYKVSKNFKIETRVNVQQGR